jgi:hypothetical protein
MLFQQQNWMPIRNYHEAVALRALGFVASRPRELARFLGDSGLSQSELMQCPTDHGHLAAVLDFVIAHEDLLRNFAAAIDEPPETAYEASRQLGHAAL